MTQVHISDGGHTVTVEHDNGELAYIVEQTRQLWRDTYHEQRGQGPAMGFSGSLAHQWDHDKQQGGMWRPVRAGDAA